MVFFAQSDLAGVSLELLAKHDGHLASSIGNVVFSPDNSRVFSGDEDGVLWVWDVAAGKGKELANFDGDEIWDLDISPDGKELAVAVVSDGSSYLKRIDLAKGEVAGSIRLRGQILGSVRYHPSGTVLAIDSGKSKGGGARFLKLADWPKADGDKVKWFDAPMKNEAGSAIELAYFEFTPDKKSMISASAESVIRVSKLPDGKLLSTFKNPGGGTLFLISLSSEGAGRVVASGNNEMVVWDLGTKGVLGRQAAGGGKGKWSIGAAGISPDGKLVASSFFRGKPAEDEYPSAAGLLLWNVPLGFEPVFELENAHGLGSNIDRVVFSRDGKIVATSADDGSIRLWKVVQK